jgi:hypothetical protein
MSDKETLAQRFNEPVCYLLEVLTAARDVLAAFSKEVGFSKAQQAYYCNMTDGEMKVAQTIRDLDQIIAQESLAATPQVLYPEGPGTAAGVKGEDFWIDELEYQIGRKVNRNYLRTWLRAFAANLKRGEIRPGQE